MISVEGTLTFTAEDGGTVTVKARALGDTAAEAVGNAAESWADKLGPAVDQALQAYTDGRIGRTTGALCPCGEPIGGPPCTADRPCSYAIDFPADRWPKAGADA